LYFGNFLTIKLKLWEINNRLFFFLGLYSQCQKFCRRWYRNLLSYK